MCELETVFRILSNQRRRLVLRCLQEHRTVTLPDLAELIAEWESGDEITELPPEQVRDVYFSLYHTHIPKLEDANFVRYEQESDLVDRTEQVVPLLVNARDAVESLIGHSSTQPS